MPEFAFDLKLTTALRINAVNEKAARKLLAGLLDCASANLGAFPSGDPILAEVSLLPGSLELYEIDGEFPGVTASMRPTAGEEIFAEGNRFRLFENPASGFRIVRLSDGAEALFHGDDSNERFLDNFGGDEFNDGNPSLYAEEADEFGAWCEANGEMSPLEPIDWEAVARREGWEVVEGDPNPTHDDAPIAPCLFHRHQDRIWPLGDWKGAARDLGIDDDEAREIMSRAA